MKHLSQKTAEKLNYLLQNLRETKPSAIAFSGGVDSSLLLAAANLATPGEVAAITCRTPLQRPNEMKEAARLAASLKVPHIILTVNPLSLPQVRANDPLRCYYCKQLLYREMQAWATANGYRTLLDGGNADDCHTYRPGRQGLAQLNIPSPLAEVGLKKEEIRNLAQAFGLENWQTPARPCLATRIPYHTPLNEPVLQKLATGEETLASFGFSDCRLRLHDNLLRIEVPPTELALALQHRQEILKKLTPLGFPYITLDLVGLCPGTSSMDKTLSTMPGEEGEKV